MRLLRGHEIVDLQLELVTIGVRVVHARADAVIDWPVGHDTMRFLLLVACGEISERVEREGDVVDACRRAAVCDVLVLRSSHDYETVVLLVEPDECCVWCSESYRAAEEVQMPLNHFLELVRRSAQSKVAY